MKTWFTGVVLASALVSPIANADYYISGIVGQTSLDVDGFDSDTGMRFSFGIPINENLSVELSYGALGSFAASDAFNEEVQNSSEWLLQQAFGDTDLSLTDVSTEVDLSSIDLAIIGRLPVSERVGVYGRAALSKWEAEFGVSGTVSYNGSTESFSDSSQSTDGTDLAIGAGLDYQMTESLYGQLEVTQYSLDDGDARLIGLGLQYHF